PLPQGEGESPPISGRIGSGTDSHGSTIAVPSPGGEGQGERKGDVARAKDAVATQRTPLQITPLGRKMLAFPIHPRYARMLLAAQEYGCVYQACLIAALTQGRDLLLRNVGRDINGLRED